MGKAFKGAWSLRGLQWGAFFETRERYRVASNLEVDVYIQTWLGCICRIWIGYGIEYHAEGTKMRFEWLGLFGDRRGARDRDTTIEMLLRRIESEVMNDDGSITWA